MVKSKLNKTSTAWQLTDASLGIGQLTLAYYDLLWVPYINYKHSLFFFNKSKSEYSLHNAIRKMVKTCNKLISSGNQFDVHVSRQDELFSLQGVVMKNYRKSKCCNQYGYCNSLPSIVHPHHITHSGKFFFPL